MDKKEKDYLASLLGLGFMFMGVMSWIYQYNTLATIGFLGAIFAYRTFLKEVWIYIVTRNKSN